MVLFSSSQAADFSFFSADGITSTAFDGAQPVATLRVGRVFLDHEKWGFFRLGVAPLVVVQNVRLQVKSANGLTNAPALFDAWNPMAHRTPPAEFRGFELARFGEPQPRLRAATARLRAPGSLELSKVRIGGPAPTTVSKAILQIAGPQAGTLRWNEGGRSSEIFVLNP